MGLTTVQGRRPLCRNRARGWEGGGPQASLWVSFLEDGSRWVGAGWPWAWAHFWDPHHHSFRVRPPAGEAKPRLHPKVEMSRSRDKGCRLSRASVTLPPCPDFQVSAPTLSEAGQGTATPNLQLGHRGLSQEAHLGALSLVLGAPGLWDS